MKDKIREIMAAVFETEIKNITEDASSETIEKWDSVNHMNLLTSLEEEFDIRFSGEEITEILNYKIIVDTIQKKITK